MMRMQFLYVHDTRLGYGRYGVKLGEALQRAGVQVDDHMEPDDADPANVAAWVATPAHAMGWHEGQLPILSTMWESGNLPELFREGLDNFHQIIVPSDHNQELFSRYHKNVVKVPLGIDELDWQFVERSQPENDFVYLIGGSGARKGLDLAYEAFRKLWGRFGSWGDGPMPRLVFKSPKNVDFWGERIERVTGFISDQQERDLYAMAHCYLQPSRGEGWGLQPLQAIAQGCPTILTDAHGHKDFAHLGYGLSTTRAKAAYFMYGDGGDWWEPSLDELCQYMEYVYYNYDEACQFARMASQIAREQFTWDTCAQQFIETIGVDILSAPYKGDGSWFKPVLRKFPVRVRRFWPCQIAGTNYQFRVGETYYVPADVKRILFEQSVLHPDCVSVSMGEVTADEVGLTPEQLERLPEYSISRMHCEMCGQMLGSGKQWEPEFNDAGDLVG